ncbi:hypothetical protein [Aestuariimicrobium ganziense]|uniref:hypothetical protein n=1 Tax=Aestuariimicrobium ganziense TaxID=2773677 RepID=UPI0019403C25|nr:hypothetical protein [Aestuariimicrobium ganziense]
MRESTRPPRARRFFRRLVVVLVVLAVLVGVGAFAAERIVRDEAERIIREQVSTALGGEATTVLHDQVVLVSLSRDRLDKVTGWVDEAVVSDGEQSVVLDHVDFTAVGVRHPRDANRVTVDKLDAKATISWAETVRITGVDLKHADGNRVEIKHTIEIWGGEVPITLSAEPGVDPATRRFTLRNPKAELSGVEVPQSLLVPLLAKLTENTLLPEVMGLRYQSLVATDEGIVVELTGTDVPLQQPR